MNDLKTDLLNTGLNEEKIDLFLKLEGKELLNELKKQRALQLEKIHEEQRKIDRLDYLIRRKKEEI